MSWSTTTNVSIEESDLQARFGWVRHPGQLKRSGTKPEITVAAGRRSGILAGSFGQRVAICTAAERINGLKIVPAPHGAGGHNNIRFNPVFRGMVRRFVAQGF